MELSDSTVTLLVAIAIIVVCCVALPKVRRTILGVAGTRDAIGALLYIVLGLVIVSIVSWVLDWKEVNEHLIGGLAFLILGIAVMVVGRVDIGASEDLTGVPARLIGLAAAIMGLLLLLPVAAG